MSDAKPAVADNEANYDADIFPLMNRIIEICHDKRIPFVATFEYAPEAYCTTILPMDEMSGDMRQLIGTVGDFKRLTSPAPPASFQITTTKADGSKVIEVVIL